MFLIRYSQDKKFFEEARSEKDTFSRTKILSPSPSLLPSLGAVKTSKVPPPPLPPPPPTPHPDVAPQDAQVKEWPVRRPVAVDAVRKKGSEVREPVARRLSAPHHQNVTWVERMGRGGVATQQR